MTHRDEDAVLAYARALDGADVWMPPGLHFEVGDRVQVLPSPECEYCSDDPLTQAACGVTGRITDIEGVTRCIGKYYAHWADHVYVVRFDDPSVGGGFDFFAISELVPLAEAPDAAATGDRGTGEGG